MALNSQEAYIAEKVLHQGVTDVDTLFVGLIQLFESTTMTKEDVRQLVEGCGTWREMSLGSYHDLIYRNTGDSLRAQSFNVATH